MKKSRGRPHDVGGIAPDYLVKKGQLYVMTMADVAALLANIFMAAQDKHIGWEHARKTLEEYYRLLNRKIWIMQEDIETGLYCCNMLDEKGKFFHPWNKTFDSFAKSFLKPGEKYDKYYNFIRKPDED